MGVAYTVKHTTEYQYSEPVSVCHNLVCLRPLERPGQRITNQQITIEPIPTMIASRVDAFGNELQHFSIERAHDRLLIVTTSEVDVDPPSPQPSNDPPWEDIAAGIAEQADSHWLECMPFLYDSPFARRSTDASEFARKAFTPGRGVHESAIALTAHIFEQFAYLPGSTKVHTKSDEALSLRSGVCQDFAHVSIAALRGLGIPAKYVSGYLRTHPPPGKPRLVGADQSHAWFSVYCGRQAGWIDFDPTNNTLCGTDHITLAIGRDYHDVAPIRGIFSGGGLSTMKTSVDVAPKSESASTNL